MDGAVTVMAGKGIGVEPAGVLAAGSVAVLPVELVGAGVELVPLPLAICAWPAARDPGNSNNPATNKTETHRPKKQFAWDVSFNRLFIL